MNAHPRIGAPKGTLSAMSAREQGGGQGIIIIVVINTSCGIFQSAIDDPDAVMETLRSLNAEYEAKFGFKFIVFVNGRPKKDLIPVLQERLKNQNVKAELELGLSEMMAIATDRLTKQRGRFQ